MNMESNPLNKEAKIEMEWTQQEALQEVQAAKEEVLRTGAGTNEMNQLSDLERAIEQTVDGRKLAEIVTRARKLKLLEGGDRQDYH